jgi:hypothetical protein
VHGRGRPLDHACVLWRPQALREEALRDPPDPTPTFDLAEVVVPEKDDGALESAVSSVRR